MRPYGHLAGGALLGALLAERTDLHPALVVVGTALAANLPDLDIAGPIACDILDIDHGINSQAHHSWVTHTPAFWFAVLSAATVASQNRSVRVRFLVKALRHAIALHLAQDTVANSLSLGWPFVKKEYGLKLDGIGQMDHAEYLKAYKSSKAWYVEQAIAALAVGAIARLWLKR